MLVVFGGILGILCKQQVSTESRTLSIVPNKDDVPSCPTIKLGKHLFCNCSTKICQQLSIVKEKNCISKFVIFCKNVTENQK